MQKWCLSNAVNPFLTHMHLQKIICFCGAIQQIKYMEYMQYGNCRSSQIKKFIYQVLFFRFLLQIPYILLQCYTFSASPSLFACYLFATSYCSALSSSPQIHSTVSVTHPVQKCWATVPFIPHVPSLQDHLLNQVALCPYCNTGTFIRLNQGTISLTVWNITGADNFFALVCFTSIVTPI